jgi:F-type H+-transporting ATPase subunit b
MLAIIRMVLISQLIVAQSFAAGDTHGGGSPWDLKWAFLNVALLFGFLIWKQKGPMKEMFDKNAKDVSALYEYANGKERDAQIRLESLQKKMANLDSEKKKIIEETNTDAQNFIKKNEEELSDYLGRIEKDVQVKLKTEKGSLERALNNSLIDEVISSAKKQIKSSRDISDKVNNQMLAQVK